MSRWGAGSSDPAPQTQVGSSNLSLRAGGAWECEVGKKGLKQNTGHRM